MAMATGSAPKLQSLSVRAVRVPMREPHQTASGAVAESPPVLTDAMFDDGLVGHSIVFTYTPLALQPVAGLIRNFASLVQGDPLAPLEIEEKLARRFRLLGTQGLVGMALAAIDMALWGALDMQHAIDARASDYVMPDVMKIGGVSGWLRAAALAQTRGLRMSNHLWPEISAQLLCVTPTAHWLEYADWWNPILAEPLAVVDGRSSVAGTLGSGVAWDEAPVKRYTV